MHIARETKTSLSVNVNECSSNQSVVCNKLRNVCPRCILWQVLNCSAQHVPKPQALVPGTAPSPDLHSTMH